MPRIPRKPKRKSPFQEWGDAPPEALEAMVQAMEAELPPKNLPLMPVRDQVYFPGMVFSLLVGREKSVHAVEEASTSVGRQIVLAIQSDLQAEEPSPEQICSMGIVAEVMQVMRVPDGTLRVMLEGIERCRVVHFIQHEPFYQVIATPLLSIENGDSETEALVRYVREQFERVIQLNPHLPPEALAPLGQAEEPGRIADLIAGALRTLKAEAQQELLECLHVTERLKRLVTLLTHETELLELQQKIRVQVEKEMGDSQREYMMREQVKILQSELGERDPQAEEFEEYRTKIQAAQMGEKPLERALKELDRLEKMPFAAPESVIVRNYLDTLLGLPWSVATPDSQNLSEAAAILDEDHYGLQKIKERILEFLAVRQLTHSSRGPILCFSGPPGVGKTSIGKSIARALGRKFIRISLGGIHDEAEIRGHRRTYIGAMTGRILQGIKQAQSCNPVFMLDEIDKLGSDFRGDPSSALLEALDPEQNHEFSDHYLEIPFDLSNVMFITTANVLDSIPHALRDRLEPLHFSGYTEMEKFAIAQQYLIPKQRTAHGLEALALQVSDDALMRLIREYTHEAGVRNLEREIATLCRKTAKRIVAEEPSKPEVSSEDLTDFLGQRRYFYGVMEEEDQVAVATGLVYTEVGGDLVTIEVSLLKGKEGRVQLTGHLGDVMKESAQTALSFVRSRAAAWGVDEDFYHHTDLHVHVPAGAVPKDGPSAGITLAIALASALTLRPIRKEIAMTGEITLRGRILPVGGLKEKILAAHRAGIREVILPKENEKDLEDLPAAVRTEMQFHFVKQLDEALPIAMPGEWGKPA